MRNVSVHHIFKSASKFSGGEEKIRLFSIVNPHHFVGTVGCLLAELGSVKCKEKERKTIF